MSFSHEVKSLLAALSNIRTIQRKINSTDGALTKAVFSTNGPLANEALDNARGGVSMEFQSLIQNVHAIKSRSPIAKAFPNIHYHLMDGISRRNWLTHEYVTTSPIKWDQVANSIFDDIPIMESAILEALKANGYPDSYPS